MTDVLISFIAVAIAVASMGLSYRSWQLADRRSRIPVLVFVDDPDLGWLLHNVGYGPALNIIVAVKKNDTDVEWQEPTRIPPIARDQHWPLTWLSADPFISVLGATYQDFLRADTHRRSRTYTVICEYDTNTITPGRHLPRGIADESLASWQRQDNSDL